MRVTTKVEVLLGWSKDAQDKKRVLIPCEFTVFHPPRLEQSWSSSRISHRSYSAVVHIILEFIRENPCSLARFPSLYYRPQHHFSLLVARADDGESEHFFWHDIEWVYIVEREEMCGSASLLCVIVVRALLRSSFGLYA